LDFFNDDLMRCKVRTPLAAEEPVDDSASARCCFNPFFTAERRNRAVAGSWVTSQTLRTSLPPVNDRLLL
jgi:hypothetical protein